MYDVIQTAPKSSASSTSSLRQNKRRLINPDGIAHFTANILDSLTDADTAIQQIIDAIDHAHTYLKNNVGTHDINDNINHLHQGARLAMAKASHNIMTVAQDIHHTGEEAARVAEQLLTTNDITDRAKHAIYDSIEKRSNLIHHKPQQGTDSATCDDAEEVISYSPLVDDTA